LEIHIELKRGVRGVRKGPDPAQPNWDLRVMLGVDCWCPNNHGTHYVEERGWNVGNMEALVERCESVYSLVESWIESGLDADDLLRQAGLPTRSDSQP